MNQNPWSTKETFLLLKHYPNCANEDLALIIGRTPNAIAHKAHKLKLRKSDAFFASSASGRFRPQLSFTTRFQRFLQSFNIFAYFNLLRWRRNIEEGDKVCIRIDRYNREELVVFLPITRKFVTVWNPKSMVYERHEMHNVFPPKCK